MPAGYSACLQLGGATKAAASSYDKLFAASTTEELTSCRQGIEMSSLNKFDIMVSASDLGGLYSPMELANWVPFLSTEATVSIRVVGDASDLQLIHTSFLLAGLSSASERRETDGSRVLVATRKPVVNTTAAPLKKKNEAVVVSLDDEDMIDEENLLNDDMLAPPPAMGARSAGDDCAGRKPCDDCTCGRADMVDASDQPTTAPSSSCGKCHLGDAFRCASCPYLGKPAFKPGEENVVLQLTDDF